MRILTAQEFASAGTVTVLGASPVNDEQVLRRMVLVREDQAYPTTPYNRYVPGFRVRHAQRGKACGLHAGCWYANGYRHLQLLVYRVRGVECAMVRITRSNSADRGRSVSSCQRCKLITMR